jgi:hypothetical protein
MLVKVGTKIRFNYGAMHPRDYGVVIKVENNIVTIKGLNEVFTEEVNLSCIRQPGETTVNGSPIGVFVEV